ncbi:MAG: hypothetical protein LKE88_02805 [Acidaminococcus provencensis]|uniref:hypothetical protein n=1 Tax=Acidaminococcus provencensis TaxID=2058289 RepID=UPI0018F289E7|nr:hypothetical protein [Acidaminococcus provencensis]MCH4095567.1 hypothetical protein [Acidaminococcus provencensis]
MKTTLEVTARAPPTVTVLLLLINLLFWNKASLKVTPAPFTKRAPPMALPEVLSLEVISTVLLLMLTESSALVNSTASVSVTPT